MGSGTRQGPPKIKKSAIAGKPQLFHSEHQDKTRALPLKKSMRFYEHADGAAADGAATGSTTVAVVPPPVTTGAQIANGYAIGVNTVLGAVGVAPIDLSGATTGPRDYFWAAVPIVAGLYAAHHFKYI